MPRIGIEIDDNYFDIAKRRIEKTAVTLSLL
jgi:DNA modification methylase